MKTISHKFLAVVSILVLTFYVAAAQQNKETEVRNLENMERQAVLNHDTITLFSKIWSSRLVINSPLNRVGTVEFTKAQIRLGKLNYASFERSIERITINENIAIVMGSEILKPQGLSDNAGKTITRRFTNIWMTTTNSWQLVARQATIIKVE
jgi:hypothetical protein